MEWDVSMDEKNLRMPLGTNSQNRLEELKQRIEAAVGGADEKTQGE